MDRDYVPDWVTNTDGQETAAKFWEELTQKLETIVPGCVESATRRG